MASQEILKKLEELESDREFMDALAQAGTPGEAIALLARYGLSVTGEEITALVSASPAFGEEELSPEDLSGVTGGAAAFPAGAKSVAQLIRLFPAIRPIRPSGQIGSIPRKR